MHNRASVARAFNCFTTAQLLLHHLVNVRLRVLVIDQRDLELVDEDPGDGRREESGQDRSKPDVLYAETQQRQQHGDGLLLHPGKRDRERQMVDVGPERVGQRLSDQDRRVRVVALSEIE